MNKIKGKKVKIFYCDNYHVWQKEKKNESWKEKRYLEKNTVFFLIKNAFKYFYFKMQFTKVKPPGKKYANFIWERL